LVGGKVHGFDYSYVAIHGQDGELFAILINLAGQEAANPRYCLILASPLRQSRPEIGYIIHILYPLYGKTCSGFCMII
jgi:hypothetical protein